MSRRRMLVISALAAALVVALAVGFTGARAVPPPSHVSAASHPPHITTAGQPPSAVSSAAIPLRFFTLVAFTYNGNPQKLAPGAVITFRFVPALHAMGGRAGCNEYGAAYALSGGLLNQSGPNYTQMRCFSPRVMAQEARYLEAFARVTTYHFDSSGLTLSDDSGAYVLRFQ